MTPVRILVDSLADQGLTNSQMTNAREIIRRLDPGRFHVSVFCGGVPGPHRRGAAEYPADFLAATAAYGEDPS